MTNSTGTPAPLHLTLAVLLAVMSFVLPEPADAQTATTYRSPWDVEYSPDGKSIAVSDATAAEVLILSAADGSVQKTIKLKGEPRGLVWSDGGLLVAEYNAGTIAVVDPASGQVSKRLTVGPKPMEIAVLAAKKLVAVTEFGLGKIIVVNQDTGAEVARVAVANYPSAIDVAATGSTAVVGHLMPTGDATQPGAGAGVSVIGLDPPKLVNTLALPQGSTAIRGVKCSPDGKWAYVTHLLGRTTLPTTHVLRAWINSDALTIIDLGSNSVYATLLLDRISEGAADPWGLAISGDGKTLWVSITGAHQVIQVDLATLHELLAGRIPSTIGPSTNLPTVMNRNKSRYKRPLSDVWFDIARDQKNRSLLQDDLGALWGAGLMKITQLLPEQGPRGIALSPDGKQLAVAVYYAGKVALLAADTGQVTKWAAVGAQPTEDVVRYGERLFYDASTTLQHWLSCNTCHPEARGDGLNWDLLNDGAGNPKNTKSMVYSAYTPPVMAHGVRASYTVAITAGFKAIKFVVPTDEQLSVVAKYLESLTAEIDPYRINGEMTDEAKRGKAVFDKAGCGTCHSGKYYTDMKLYDVGTKNTGDSKAEFDTPTLLEMWRTAPYLHDGSAATIKDVLTTANVGDKHGKTSQLSPVEIDELAAYVLQLGTVPWDGTPPPRPVTDGGTGTAGATGTGTGTAGAGGSGGAGGESGGGVAGISGGGGGEGGSTSGSSTDGQPGGGPSGTSPGDNAGAGGSAGTSTHASGTSSRADAGCVCNLGARSTRTASVTLGLLGLALFWLGRRRHGRRGSWLAGLLAFGILATAMPSAQAAPIDLKDPKFASIDKILVIKRPKAYSHIVYSHFGHQSGPGGLFILENVISGAATEKNVLAGSVCASGLCQGKRLEGGAFMSPDLSYDAKQILFAYADKGGPFHIFRVNVDGTGLTQLTDGRYDDFDPVFLPDGRYMFVSTRRGGYGRCHTMTMPTYTLYGMNADGTNIHAVSLHETNEWNPSVDNYGMIIYSRWDYVDRGSAYVHHGWITTPDGLDARATFTNFPPVSDNGNTIMGGVPNAVLQLRAIPNSNKWVGTACGHHGSSYGSLVMIDPDIEDDDGMAQYTRITPDAGFPETGGVCPDCEAKYATPWPLSEDHFLCVYSATGNNHAVHLIDRQGNRTLIKGGAPYLDPIPLAPRPKPVSITPSITSTDLKADVIVTLVNVYDSFYPMPQNTEIKFLRIVQVHPKTTIQANSPRLGHGGTDANEQNGRSVLGTVPVESDGSASFLLPPGKPVYFQALDKDGVAVQSMMSDTYAIPGSTRLTCQGCHEPRYRTARPPKSMPIAMLRSPTPIVVEADGTKPMNFPRLIQPILDKKCNPGCHQTQAPVLTGGGSGFSTAYRNLAPYATYYLSNYPGIGRPSGFSRRAQTQPVRSIPGKFVGARTSRLYPLLEAKHKGVTLTPQELRAFALWLDNNSDFYGHPENIAAQARGEVVPPRIE